MTAVVAINAANMAYRKAIRQTRDAVFLKRNFSPWMAQFAELLPEPSAAERELDVKDTPLHRREKAQLESPHKYDQLAFYVWLYITNTVWFETFIMVNIILIGTATGLDLDNNGRPEPLESVDALVNGISIFTTVVFTIECVVKVVAEGHYPMRYFTDPENGHFNKLDFAIVVGSFAFMGSTNGSMIGALRMLRLVRLFTFIKGVQQLRVIVSGLITGMKSVLYIVVLLFLVIYIFSIMACLFFGSNDPARFGSVVVGMITLFQVSTLASWTSIAYTSFFGCDAYLGDPYGGGGNSQASNPSMYHTQLGSFQGHRCGISDAKPALTFVFFHTYIVLTSWVIMSLFIGVISMGMFEAFEDLKARNLRVAYLKRLEENANANPIPDENHPVNVVKGAKSKGSLKDKIDVALENVHHYSTDTGSPNQIRFQSTVAWCLKIRDSTHFTVFVTLTIVMVSLMIGIDADQGAHCERYRLRNLKRDPEDIQETWCDDVNVRQVVVAIVAQVVFTWECAVKILAEGYTPMTYFTDRENGTWNKFDFFIVVVGFLEMTPAKAIFEYFPVVVFRLLRLLRVFRLAKALPRLRSIVQALISGFAVVGWIVVLMVVFNYITACMMMLGMQASDPFHFGNVARAMFTMLRMQTLDSWDQILNIAIFGCDVFPAGYPFTQHPEGALDAIECTEPKAWGWLSVPPFLVVIILGAYVLPTVLVGIVSISFEEANKTAEVVEEMAKGVDNVVVKMQHDLPAFFKGGRMDLLRSVFDALDADGKLTLDVHEIALFWRYVFMSLFNVELTLEQQEALFHLLDLDGSTELGYPEFVHFIGIVKALEEACRNDEVLRDKYFPPLTNPAIPPGAGGATPLKPVLPHNAAAAAAAASPGAGSPGASPGTSFDVVDARSNALSKPLVSQPSKRTLRRASVGASLGDLLRHSSGNLESAKEVNAHRIRAWNQIVAQHNEDALASAWSMVLDWLGEDRAEGEANPRLMEVFNAFDADGGGNLDVAELTAGLQSFDIYLTKAQVIGLMPSADADDDKVVSFQEFSDHVNAVRRARNERKAKSRWLTLAKSVGKTYDEALEDLDQRELQRRVEESERVERAMQRNFALREQADRDQGSDLNTVIGAAVSTMLGRAADDLLPSGAETPQGWLHHDLNKEVIHANTSSTAKLAGGAAKAHAASGAHGAHPTSSAAAAAVAGTTISTVAAAAPGHASDLEYEPPAELVRLLSDRLTVELFALRNQANAGTLPTKQSLEISAEKARRASKVVKTFKTTLLDAAKKMKKQEAAAEAKNNGSGNQGNTGGHGARGGPALQQSRSSGSSLEDESTNATGGRSQRISLGRNPMANGLDHASGSFEDDRYTSAGRTPPRGAPPHHLLRPNEPESRGHHHLLRPMDRGQQQLQRQQQPPRSGGNGNGGSSSNALRDANGLTAKERFERMVAEEQEAEQRAEREAGLQGGLGGYHDEPPLSMSQRFDLMVSRERAHADAEPHLSSREKFERMVRDSQDEEERRSQQRSLGMPHKHKHSHNYHHYPAPVIGFQAYRQTRSRGYSSDGEERNREQQRKQRQDRSRALEVQQHSSSSSSASKPRKLVSKRSSSSHGSSSAHVHHSGSNSTHSMSRGESGASGSTYSSEDSVNGAPSVDVDAMIAEALAIVNRAEKYRSKRPSSSRHRSGSGSGNSGSSGHSSNGHSASAPNSSSSSSSSKRALPPRHPRTQRAPTAAPAPPPPKRKSPPTRTSPPYTSPSSTTNHNRSDPSRYEAHL